MKKNIGGCPWTKPYVICDGYDAWVWHTPCPYQETDPSYSLWQKGWNIAAKEDADRRERASINRRAYDARYGVAAD